jgi:ribosome-binding protein aMBF1 (putative translation factor)
MRLDACKQCHAELHVCRMCMDYDVKVAKHCREPTAEEVSEKTRANFCGFFQPRINAYKPENTAELSDSLKKLDELFAKR